MTTGSIIALAWPETKVIKEGKWYDTPMRWLGFLKNNYYKAGHAALVLVNHNTLEFKYYDFGRYHTPCKHGRVRSYDTDPELKLETKADIHNNQIQNIQELLIELQLKSACHGDGVLWASSYTNIDLEKAYLKANNMQDLGIIPYGPLKFKGTNCSRFVSQVAKYSTHNWLTKLVLIFPYTISASPKFNIRVINNSNIIYKLQKPIQQIINKTKLVKKSA